MHVISRRLRARREAREFDLALRAAASPAMRQELLAVASRSAHYRPGY